MIVITNYDVYLLSHTNIILILTNILFTVFKENLQNCWPIIVIFVNRLIIVLTSLNINVLIIALALNFIIHFNLVLYLFLDDFFLFVFFFDFMLMIRFSFPFFIVLLFNVFHAFLEIH